MRPYRGESTPNRHVPTYITPSPGTVNAASSSALDINGPSLICTRLSRYSPGDGVITKCRSSDLSAANRTRASAFPAHMPYWFRHPLPLEPFPAPMANWAPVLQRATEAVLRTPRNVMKLLRSTTHQLGRAL